MSIEWLLGEMSQRPGSSAAAQVPAVLRAVSSLRKALGSGTCAQLELEATKLLARIMLSSGALLQVGLGSRAVTSVKQNLAL